MTLAIMSILAVGGFEAIKGMDLVGKMVFCQGYHLSKLGQGSLASSIIGKQDYFARNLCEQTKYDNTNETMVQQENQKLSLEETEALPPASPESKQVGAIYQEQPRNQDVPENAMVNQLRRTMDFSFLIQNFYIVDATTSVSGTNFPVKELLTKDMSLARKNVPQILIYHTHGASEAYADSKAGKEEDSVVGTGNLLSEELKNQYGYQVIHDKTKYDLINGKIDRSLAYNYALNGIRKILQENPKIRVVIDLHRDGVAGKRKDVVEIDGKKTAQIMFFNGLSRGKNGEIAYLKNRNRTGNLAFSLQLKCKAMNRYPGLTKPIYLKGYRYNLHMRERSLLIELGNQNNTCAEIHNAIKPLAKIIDEVLNPS